MTCRIWELFQYVYCCSPEGWEVHTTMVIWLACPTEHNPLNWCISIFIFSQNLSFLSHQLYKDHKSYLKTCLCLCPVECSSSFMNIPASYPRRCLVKKNHSYPCLQAGLLALPHIHCLWSLLFLIPGLCCNSLGLGFWCTHLLILLG